MSDELLRKLAALAEGCEAMSFGVEGNPRETDFMAADVVNEAIAEIARLREERRWVPVGERLPTHRRPVIANCPSAYGPTEATYHHGKWHDFAGWLEHPVTEWKEMPPGPEGDA